MKKAEIDLNILELESSMIFHPAREANFQTKNNLNVTAEPTRFPSRNLPKSDRSNMIDVDIKNGRAKLVVGGNYSDNRCKSCFSILCNSKNPNCQRLYIIIVLSICLILTIIVPILVYTLSNKSNASNANAGPLTTKAFTTTLFSSTTTPNKATQVSFFNLVIMNGSESRLGSNKFSNFTDQVALVFLNLFFDYFLL